MPTLTFDHVNVTHRRDDGSALVALEDFSLEIAAGESVAIIGPSGCGKSTLLRAACGLLTPTAGSVLVDGVALNKPRRDTALILQDFGLLPWKTVQQNAELGLQIAHVPAAERHARAKAALAQVELGDFAHAYPGELSGGMKQRLAIARALAQNADILLMDEPLSALDALLRESLQDTLLDVWQSDSCTQVLVTHSIEEAVYLGGRIVVMSPRPGRITAVVDNPGQGTKEWRSTPEFFATCTKVRALLNDAVAAAETESEVHA